MTLAISVQAVTLSDVTESRSPDVLQMIEPKALEP
jgi:hypothetical protein